MKKLFQSIIHVVVVLAIWAVGVLFIMSNKIKKS